MYKDKAIVDIAHLITLLSGLLDKGHTKILMKEAYDEEAGGYVLVVHPVVEGIYESFKPDVDKLDLN